MYIKYSNKAYLSDDNLREVLDMSGELLEGVNIKEITLESELPGIVESANDIIFDIVQDKCIYKTNNHKKLSKLKRMQKLVLEMLKPIMEEISAQDSFNTVKKNKNKDNELIYNIHEDDVEAISEYRNIVLNFHNTWNPDDYTLEQITPEIFNYELELPAEIIVVLMPLILAEQQV